MSGTGNKISNLRNKRGLTQQELADRLNVSRSLVAMWENGRRTPDYFSIAAMAKVFGVEKTEIIDNKHSDVRHSTEATIIDNEIADMIGGTDLTETKEELSKRVNAFLSKQNTKDNEIFMARYLFKKSYKEIATDLRISQNAVSVKLTRLRKRLRRFIKENEK